MNSRKRFKSVHQFHPGTGTGDAITNDMLQVQMALRDAGYESEIYAQHIAKGLERQILPIRKFLGGASSLLIVHHSMGFDIFEDIIKLPSRKILRYHNITPAHFFSNRVLRNYSDKGRQQLQNYRNFVEFALGVSEYNRSELNDLGYKYTASLPICFDSKALLEQPTNRTLADRLSKTFNLLFVGRIAQNKKQKDLIRIFDSYRRIYPSSRLILIGSSAGCEDYLEELQYTICKLGLQANIELPGKVSNEDLATYYRSAHIFLSASEHEGFGVPLLEAMAFELPILAFRSTAVPETLGSSGILFDSKEPGPWCEVIEQIRTTPELRKLIIRGQKERLLQFNSEQTTKRLLYYIQILEDASRPFENCKPTVQIQGPFESSYSLAAVNRNLALSLDTEGTFDVSIHCTEGPGDYQPEEKNLADKPKAADLWRKSKLLSGCPDIVIRNLYPPRVHDVPGRKNFLYFFWEDSLIPQQWAVDFNRYLDGILAPSKHVERVLRNSGVSVPVHVISAGIEEKFLNQRRSHSPGSMKAPFTFLHVSSGFPRKGVDLLLEAFFTEFSKSDHIQLILKTFPNIHNDVQEQVAMWQKRLADAPCCIHLDKDISEQELLELYDQADCLVYPSRAEGFGLPVAEAMAWRIPVIVTAYSGHMDFCSQEDAFLVNYHLVPSKSHLNVPGAQWAEPDVNHLREQMRFVFENRKSEMVKKKIEAAYQNIKENFRWELTASRFKKILANHMDKASKPKKRLAMVTSWDARCGIAEYSRYLLEAVVVQNSDIEPLVLSSPGEGIWQNHFIPYEICWRNRGEGDLAQVRHLVLDSGIEVVHFQFNFGFFELKDFARTINEFKQAGKRVIITLHRTADLQANGTLISLKEIFHSLRMADMLLVHSKRDQEQLASFGIRENVLLFPHGNLVYPMEDMERLRQELGVTLDPIIGSFGFLLPHKGILELLNAVKQLTSVFPNIGLVAQCALHWDEISRQFEARVRNRIQELQLDSRVLLSTEFVAPEEAALLLQLADVIVLPYSRTAESSSAAVRFALGADRPVITTKQPIFEEVADFTYQVKSNDPRELARGIECVLKDQDLAAQLKRKARSYSEETSWDRVARHHARLIESLTESRSHDNAVVSSS